MIPIKHVKYNSWHMAANLLLESIILALPSFYYMQNKAFVAML